MKRKERFVALILALVSAVAVLMIATTSSPLYATNFWTDTNIYFTIGRGMTQGLMPYTDLFDHKGPLLYMIYAVGALVSNTTFLGVFLLEVASMTATLMLSYELVSLFGRGWINLLAIPVTAIVTTCSTAFNQGGSAEEFVLPALLLALYVVVRRMLREEERPARWYLLFGLAMGWTFAIKYTDCGLFLGLALGVLLLEWCRHGFFAAFRSGLWALCGMVLILVPVALYLAWGGALASCLEAYFYENIFLYAGEPMTLWDHVLNALAYLRTQSMANPAIAALSYVGVAWMVIQAIIKRSKGFVLAAITVPLGAFLMLLFTYWGEVAHPYYALVFAALTPLALCPLGLLAARLKDWKWSLTALVPLAVSVPLCLNLCLGVPLMSIEREEMTQVWFGELINQSENPTMLDWTDLDQGFYLAAGVTPTCRYFANNNLDSEEKRQAYESYLTSGEVQYIVTSNYQEDPGPQYMLIGMEEGVFDLGVTRVYKLFEYIGDAAAEEGWDDWYE